MVGKDPFAEPDDNERTVIRPNPGGKRATPAAAPPQNYGGQPSYAPETPAMGVPAPSQRPASGADANAIAATGMNQLTALATPLLSLVGSIGAALTLGVRGGGALLALLILPLFVPALIFASGAVEAQIAGVNANGYLLILAAMLALAVFFAPWATSAAVKVALE